MGPRLRSRGIAPEGAEAFTEQYGALQWGRGCAAAESDSLASLELSMIWSTSCERRWSGGVINKDCLLPPSHNLMIPFTLTRASDPHALHATLPLARSGAHGAKSV